MKNCLNNGVNRSNVTFFCKLITEEREMHGEKNMQFFLNKWITWSDKFGSSNILKPTNGKYFYAKFTFYFWCRILEFIHCSAW